MNYSEYFSNLDTSSRLALAQITGNDKPQSIFSCRPPWMLQSRGQNLPSERVLKESMLLSLPARSRMTRT